MGFQDSAFSLRSRLHIGEVRPAVLIGVLLVAAVVLTFAVIGVVTATKSHSFEVLAASQENDEWEGEGASGVVSDDSGATVVEPALICVHVSGCVISPGVCYVEEGSRVADAVAAAGGLAEGAASDAVNLARVLNDGEQVVIPSLEEISAAQETNASGASVVSGADAYSASGAGGLVNINTADAAQLQTLNGIGEATAAKIIKDREANGPYQTIEDIKRVSGIGDKKFENIKDSICVG